MSRGTIEITDLVVRYGAVPAVNGVSFTVGQGEHVTLLGPSGCGKTTTLRAVAGLEEPAGGSIRIDGETVFSTAQRTNGKTRRLDGIPVLCGVAAYERGRECRLWASGAETTQGASCGCCRAGIRPCANARPCRPFSRTAVGRATAARRPCSGDCVLAHGPAL